MVTDISVHFCVVIEGMPTCNTRNFGNEPVVYVFVVVGGIYTCKTGNFVNKKWFLCRCLCCYIVYVHM